MSFMDSVKEITDLLALLLDHLPVWVVLAVLPALAVRSLLWKRAKEWRPWGARAVLVVASAIWAAGVYAQHRLTTPHGRHVSLLCVWHASGVFGSPKAKDVAKHVLIHYRPVSE